MEELRRCCGVEPDEKDPVSDLSAETILRGCCQGVESSRKSSREFRGLRCLKNQVGFTRKISTGRMAGDARGASSLFRGTTVIIKMLTLLLSIIFAQSVGLK